MPLRIPLILVGLLLSMDLLFQTPPGQWEYETNRAEDTFNIRSNDEVEVIRTWSPPRRWQFSSPHLRKILGDDHVGVHHQVVSVGEEYLFLTYVEFRDREGAERSMRKAEAWDHFNTPTKARVFKRFLVLVQAFAEKEACPRLIGRVFGALEDSMGGA